MYLLIVKGHLDSAKSSSQLDNPFLFTEADWGLHSEKVKKFIKQCVAKDVDERASI